MRMSVGVGPFRFYSNGSRMTREGRSLALTIFVTMLIVLIAIKYWYISLPVIAVSILAWKLRPTARKRQQASEDKPTNQASVVSNRR